MIYTSHQIFVELSYYGQCSGRGT